MLAEATGVTKIVIACGRTDLRKGIDGLAQLVGTKYNMNPFEKNVLFLRIQDWKSEGAEMVHFRY